MLSWNEKITTDEETERLLDAICAAVEFDEPELDAATSSLALYQRLRRRIGIVVPTEPQIQPAPFKQAAPPTSKPIKETLDDAELQRFYWCGETVLHTQAGWRVHIRSNI